MARARSSRKRDEDDAPDSKRGADDEIGIFRVEDEVDPSELQDTLEEMVEDGFRVWKIIPVGDDECTLCVVGVAREAKNVIIGE